MRIGIIAIPLLSMACTHHSVPPEPKPLCRLTDATRVPQSLIGAQGRDPRIHDMVERESADAARVDTIVIVFPDSFVVQLGHAIPDSVRVQAEGTNRSGERFVALPTWLAIEDESIAQYRDAGLTGLKVGRTQLVVSLFSTDSLFRVHAPPSCVPIRVIP